MVMAHKTAGVLVGLGIAASMVLSACGSGGTTTGNGSSATGGSTATAGGSTADPTLAKADGNFNMVKIKFNEMPFGIVGTVPATPGAGNGDGFDQGGALLDGADPVWPTAVGETKVADTAGASIPIWWAGTGLDSSGAQKTPTALNFGPELGQQSVTVPQGKYKNVYIVTASGNGNFPIDLTYHYSDGSTGTGTTQDDDWCNAAPTGGVAAFTPADRLDDTGASETPACGVFLNTIAVDQPTKTLTSIDFVIDPNGGAGTNFEPSIFAITLEKA